MNTNYEEFLRQMEDADMVLIGIGEEFNNIKKVRQDEKYNECRQKLEQTVEEWLIPALNLYFESSNSDTLEVLQKFADLLEKKNYFVVSVSTNDLIRKVVWREKRLVMPCGGSELKQCINKCENSLTPVTDENRDAIKEYIIGLQNNTENRLDIGKCPVCGNPMVLNNIYVEKYDEEGYLDQWQLYTKWLQGTLNRKLLILELGVGMQCPSVIRWPFEKVAFFNQKASFWRVNENLYQLSEEIKEKGTSISQNAIDWLRDLC